MATNQSLEQTVDEIFDTLVKSRFIEMFDKYRTNMKTLDSVCESITAGGDKPNIVSPVETKECKYPIYSNGETNLGLYGYTNRYTISKPAVTISARGTIGFTAVRDAYFTPIVRLITLIPSNDLNCIYLKHALKGSISGNAGSSIQQLTVPNVKKIKIPLPPLDEQVLFEEFVKQIDKSKVICKQMVSRFDDLVKSRFIEMFSQYLGEGIPLSEIAVFLRNGANIKQEKGQNGYPITRIETLANGVFNTDRFGYADITDLSRYEKYILQSGDLLISHINSGIYVGKTVQYRGECFPVIHGMNLLCLRLKEACHPSFFEYYMKTDYARSYIHKITKQSVNQASFSVTDLNKMLIPCPPIDLQLQFESFINQVDKSKSAFINFVADRLKYDSRDC